MAPPVAWKTEIRTVAGTSLHLARAGRGTPVVVLHHDTGTPDRLAFYDALAASHQVVIPYHPGFGRSERPEWLRSVRDVAVMYRTLLADLDMADAALVGLGFGGWIAAEMATMAPGSSGRLALVGAMGVKPPDGDILDQALVGYIDYAAAAFHDRAAFEAVYGTEPSTDQLVEWDVCREMCFRIAWKPYMYSQTLPHLLGGIRARTLLVWGDDDRVVPRGAADRYMAGLANARLEIVPSCGHAVGLERPDALAGLVEGMLGAA